MNREPFCFDEYCPIFDAKLAREPWLLLRIWGGKKFHRCPQKNAPQLERRD